MEEQERIYWHQGFYGGLELEFVKQKNDLLFVENLELTKLPVQMDMMVIKKDKNVAISNEIGHIFRQYNILEYKSPDARLSINELYKTIGYATFYKGMSVHVDDVPVTEMSISIFRHRFPRKLFEDIEKVGGKIEKHSPGIYYVSGIINIPVQIVITKELSKKDHLSLRILTRDADEDDVRNFIKMTSEENQEYDRINTDAVLQVSVAANQELYEKLRKENSMCEALRELMKEDIEAAKEEARKEVRISERKKYKAKLAEKDGILAEKDARIAELEAMLAAATKE